MDETKKYALDMAADLVKASLSNHAHHASKDAGKRIADMYEIVYRKLIELMKEDKVEEAFGEKTATESDAHGMT